MDEVPASKTVASKVGASGVTHSDRERSFSSRHWVKTRLFDTLLHLAAELEASGWRQTSPKKDRLELVGAMLKVNENLFQQMFDSSHESFWLAQIKPRGRMLYIAPSCKNILGISQEEVCRLPWRWFSLILKADRKRVWEAFKNIAEGRLEAHEFRILRPDGSIRWIRNEGWAVNHGDEQTEGMSGVIQDITATVQLREELIKISEHEQQHIVEELKDGIGQHLAGTSLVCKVLYNKLAARNDPATHDMARICYLLTTAVAETRQLSESLSPISTGVGGLTEALHKLSVRTSALFSVSCIFRCGPEVTVPSKTMSANLYGIAKEAVSNAVKSRDADKIRIRLQKKGQQMLLSITDNGSRFRESTQGSQAIGLRMMTYRASESGGHMKVEKGKRGGTIVTCSIPLEAKR